MKKVVTVGIGRKNFIIDQDAYEKLSRYLSAFRGQVGMGYQTDEVMENLEERIAELFTEELGNRYDVVNIAMVNNVIARLGMPDGSQMEFNEFNYKPPYEVVVKKLYRDVDDKFVGGVCSGLALYFNVDVVMVRLLWVAALVMVGAGFWVYLLFWAIVPKALTATQKCEMRGIPATAENLRRFSRSTH